MPPVIRPGARRGEKFADSIPRQNKNVVIGAVSPFLSAIAVAPATEREIIPRGGGLAAVRIFLQPTEVRVRSFEDVYGSELRKFRQYRSS